MPDQATPSAPQGQYSFADQSLLITGGTGSLGTALISTLLALPQSQSPRRIICFSRDEFKQHQQARQFGADPRLRYFIGDVRDLSRLTLAFRDVQLVIHAAALKQVPALEYNPTEAVRTNINGSMNVMLAALGTNVQKVLAVSTDKAVNPINLYGATKLCMERVLLAGNVYTGRLGHPVFSVVRYGNVAGSRGSVIPLFREKAARGETLPITDERMTRFWITLPAAAEFVLGSLAAMRGRELFVPRMPSVRIMDLAEAIGAPWEIVGLRPGEKLHETVVGETEQVTGLPSPYVSDENSEWLTTDNLRQALEAI